MHTQLSPCRVQRFSSLVVSHLRSIDVLRYILALLIGNVGVSLNPCRYIIFSSESRHHVVIHHFSALETGHQCGESRLPDCVARLLL